MSSWSYLNVCAKVSLSFHLAAAQVVSVQATNLTSQDMHLTLLAPSSLAASPLLVMSLPTNSTVLNMGNKSYHSLTPREVLAWEDVSTKPIAELSSGRLSLPPVQPMEIVLGVKPTVLKERIFPASGALLDSVAPRTHLWLQSTVPLGYVSCILHYNL